MIKKINLFAIAISILLIGSCSLKDDIEDAIDDTNEPTSIALISGASQTAFKGETLTEPITIQVRDQAGNAYEGATVYFSVEEGSISAESAVSDINGEVSVTWTLGPKETSQVLTATSKMLDDETELYGSPLTVYATANSQTVTDIDGNVYKAITIGNQVWMAENLKVTRYSDGREIPLVTENAGWSDYAAYTANAFCYVNNDENSDYGAFYTWVAATDSINSLSNPSGVQGACPTGWHIPSEAEWKELVNYLGGYSDANKKLKSTTDHWFYSDEYNTNESGFTALGAGIRSSLDDGQVKYQKNSAIFTTSTSDGNNFSKTVTLWYDNSDIRFDSYQKASGKSVRCVKD